MCPGLTHCMVARFVFLPCPLVSTNVESWQLLNYTNVNKVKLTLGVVEVQLYSFFNPGARRNGWSTPRPGRFTPRNMNRYPPNRRLGGPQGLSGWVRKISPPPGFSSRTIQPVASRYTDWAIPAVNYTRRLVKQRQTQGAVIPTRWAGEVWLHSFYISALDGGMWPTSRPARSTFAPVV
jgi:hypothetical protein